MSGVWGMILNDPNEIECDLPEEGAALGLLGLIKGISEWGWCAGWMSGIEYDLWEAEAGKRIGQQVLSDRQATLLRLLSEECNGWWGYGDNGLRFYSKEQWLSRLGKRADK